MKPIYRIRPVNDAKGIKMYALEEGTKANRKRNGNGIQKGRRWQIVTLAYNLDILRGFKDDITGQTAEEHNGLRKQS